MNATEIYKLEPIRVSTDLDDLVGFCTRSFLYELQGIEIPEKHVNKAIVIKTLAYKDFDGRRIWELRTIWFSGFPIMIIQNAGREGEDHTKRYITDVDIYHNMLEYLQHIAPPRVDPENDDIIDPEEDIEGLTDFYSCRLEDILANKK